MAEVVDRSSLHRVVTTSGIGTLRVAKHRLFVWAGTELLPDARLYAFANEQDWFLGLLHSHVHEVWSLAKATWPVGPSTPPKPAVENRPNSLNEKVGAKGGFEPLRSCERQPLKTTRLG